jgi:hypothetical protein
MTAQISLDDECAKCGVSLRRQILLALLIDAGAQTIDPSQCPEGGDHDFQSNEESNQC